MAKTSTIRCTSVQGISPGAALLVGDGEIVRVKAVSGGEVTVTRWRWWHTAGGRVRIRLRRLREAAIVRWCALRRHPLDGFCRCGERQEPGLAEDW